MSFRSSVFRPAPLALLVALSACDESNPSTVPSGVAPSALRVAGGDGQNGVAGAALPEPIAVVVVDAAGTGIPGVAVRFAVVAGGGQVATQTVASDAHGLARTAWTLGAVAADSQVVEARLDGVPPVRLRAAARPDAPAALAVAGGNGAAGPVGAALADSLAVTVKDRLGNPVAGLEVAWSAVAGGGSVSPARTVTGPGGVAKTRWTLGTRVDSAQTVVARVAGLDSVAFTANAVTTGVPLRLAKRGGDEQRGAAGSVLVDSLAVALLMQDGRPVAGALVTWSVPAQWGSIAPLVTRTDANGAASAVWRLGTAPGVVQATATVDDGTLVFNAVVGADAPSAIAAVAGGGEGPVGGVMADSLAVRVVDQYGNPVAGAEIDWAAQTGSGSVQPARSATDAQGISRAAWTLGLRVGAPGQTASATLTGFDPVRFTATAVTRGVPLRLAKRGGDEQHGAAGSVLADSLAVALLMQDGHPVAGALVTWSVPPQWGSIAPLVTRTDANGAASAVWRVGTAPGVVQATATVDDGTLVFSAVVGADAPASVQAVAGGGEGPVGGPLADSLAVRVVDKYGNPVAGAEIDWSAQTGSGSVQPARSATDAQGIARARWTLGPRVGPPGQTASATLAGLPPVTFQATAVTRGVPLQLARTAGDGQAGEVRTALADSLVVQLRTPSGAPVEGATVVWASTAAGSHVLPATSRTDAQGFARAAWTLGTAAGAQQASATVDQGALAFAATARPAGAYGLRSGGGDGQSATRGTILADSLVVRVVDAYGNKIPGAWVRWRVVGGGGRVEADSTLTGGDGGARVRWAVGLAAGANRVVATSPALTGQIAFNATAQDGDLVLTRISRVPIPTAGGSNTVDFFNELLVARVTDAQGAPVVGAAVRWPPRPVEVYSSTGWDGRAEWRWQAAVHFFDGDPIHLTAQFEDDTVQWHTVRLRAREYEFYIYGIEFDPQGAVAGDTVQAYAWIDEVLGRFPPSLTVDWWDDDGWSASGGDVIRWPVGSKTGERTITACTNSGVGGDACASATFWVDPAPDPSDQRR